MDIGSLLTLGLNLAGTGAKHYQANRMDKLRRGVAKKEHGAAVRSAQRNLFATQDELGRGRRKLEESLFARGVGDSTIARDELAYFDRQGGRAIEGAREQENLANMRLSAFKKQIQQQRLARYLDLGLQVGNAGLGAYTFGSRAPAPEFPSYLGDQG